MLLPFHFPVMFLSLFIVLSSCGSGDDARQEPAVVFQTDFGLKDGAVAAMKGVAREVSAGLDLYDLTHEIPPYDIWEAGYRLRQTVDYWPAGTVFVSVVDPGVGTDRRSVVALLNNGSFVVTPDNGVLTLLSEWPGIHAMRIIDEKINRRAGSAESYTFHGRDVYSFVAARLASGAISFDGVGPVYTGKPRLLDYQHPKRTGDTLIGGIPALDVQYGNVWSNISDSLFKTLQIPVGGLVNVEIRHDSSVVYQETVPYAATFGAVDTGKALVYLNSLMNVSIALNQDDFAKRFSIGKGSGWTIVLNRTR